VVLGLDGQELLPTTCGARRAIRSSADIGPRPAAHSSPLVSGVPRHLRSPYDNLMTPYDKLRSLPDAHAVLKPGLSFEYLDQEAYKLSDNETAKQLNEARHHLFQSIFNRPKSVS
jgi:hypothetical protein